jgi:tetratricopeptide (TPR) repeat protein
MSTRELEQRARAERARGDLAAAAATFREAIRACDDPARRADLYGMLGGTLREQGELAAAVAAYDSGFRDEPPGSSTYNALNRLVTRILLEPRSASDPEALRGRGLPDVVNIPEGLAEVRARLRDDVAGRRADDYWAAGDLALAAALTGDVAEVRAALDHFDRLGPPAAAYAKYREMFDALAALDTPQRGVLREVRDELDRRSGGERPAPGG